MSEMTKEVIEQGRLGSGLGLIGGAFVRCAILVDARHHGAVNRGLRCPNGFVPVTGVAQYVNTSKFPEAVVTLRPEGNRYGAQVNGVIMLQGTVEDSVIPFSRRWVGVSIQNHELVFDGGGPRPVDDFRALTP